MKKTAVSHEETLSRTLQVIKSKQERQLELESAFGSDIRKMQKMDRQLIDSLFVQGPANITTAPNLSKVASATDTGDVAPTVAAFFEKHASASEKVKRAFPELARP